MTQDQIQDVRVERATTADRQRVVSTVAAAFEADPAFAYFFPRRASREREVETFAAFLFDQRVGGGTVWVVDGGASVAMWERPLRSDPDGAAEERPAMDLPVDTLARLDVYHRAVKPLLPRTPFWYLGVLATHPEHAGKRFGRAVMRPGLASAAADGLPAYLETTNPENVKLYERAGWEVTASTTIDDLGIWVLRQ